MKYPTMPTYKQLEDFKEYKQNSLIFDDSKYKKHKGFRKTICKIPDVGNTDSRV